VGAACLLLAGYPGVTSRYKLPAELRFALETRLPEARGALQA
jgi:hypothetical protein